MAVLTVFHAPLAAAVPGTVTFFSATQVTITGGSVTQNYYGTGFTTDGFTVTGGTVTHSDYSDSLNGGLQYTLTGLSHSAATVSNYVLSGDVNGVNAYLLGGDDVLNGSADAELLLGYGGNDSILGGGGNDYLDGYGQSDTLKGGGGDDTYIVHGTEGLIQENSAEGTDTVFSDVSLVLPVNFENLVLAGAATEGTGNAGNNSIAGNGGANTLDGTGGNDTLDGGSGDDALAGGAGGDTLLGGEGRDTLDGGADADDLRGGFGDDTYVLDALDAITDEGGADTVHAGFSGYVLGAGLERLTLIGGAAGGSGNDLANLLTGNALGNTLAGAAGNDTLDGGAGADTLAGGLDDDTYEVDSPADSVVENADEGHDRVRAAVDFELGDNVEELELLGQDAVSGTGNAQANAITGNGAANVLSGAGGSDTLTGGRGVDTLIGGSEDDAYFVGATAAAGASGIAFLADTVEELPGSGADTVYSSSSFALPDGAENLVLTGAPLWRAYTGTGNSLDNTLAAEGSARHRLYGEGGNDTLLGGAGRDTLDGGAGDDSLVGNGGDVLVDGAGNDAFYITGTDVITGSGEAGTEGVVAVFSGYTLADGLENLFLQGAAASGGGNALDNLLAGNSAYANSLQGAGGGDTLAGAGFADTLDGGAGADSMAGGAGDDVYIVDDAADIAAESAGQGYDIVHAAASIALGAELEELLLVGGADIDGTGNGLDNALTGNSGNNFLDGSAGADTYFGSAGDDTYVLDVSAGDVVLELASGGGVDTVRVSVSYSLDGVGSNVENIMLVGTGAINATGDNGSNLLTGNDAANYLDGLAGIGTGDTLAGAGGNDTLDGSTSLNNATLMGGAGDDWYLANGDLVIEDADGGLDTVVLSVVNNYVLPDNVENLVGSGTGNALANTITGSGALSGAGGNDTLVGGALGDTLDGGAGADSMAGGAGADTYVVDDAGDAVVELGGGGFDSILGAMSLSIAALPNVEAIVLQGAGNFAATGNTADNFIIGNGGNNSMAGGDGHDTFIGLDGADTLDGGAGNDTLTGGAGGDSLAGGAGDDWLIWEAGDAGIDGGADFDTLDIGGNGTALDLTLVADALIQNVEAIDLATPSPFNDTLTLAAADVLALSSTTNTLRVDGEAGDAVSAADVGWSFVQNVLVGAQTYAEYANGAALLQVDVDITHYLLPRLPLVSLSGLDGTSGFRISGVASPDQSGFAVSDAGDVNGDGYGDLMVGAPGVGNYAGASYVVFGSASGFGGNVNLSGLDGLNGYKLAGVVGGGFPDGDNAGKSVSEAGDVNGDGFGDVILGAFRADPNGIVSGASYLVFGGTGAYLDGLHGASGFNLSGLDGTNGVQFNGAASPDFSGISVSAAGDVNGDGYSDLIVGAYGASGFAGASYVVFGGSNAYLDTLHDTSGFTLSGVNGSNGFELSGAAANDFSGFSVAGAGDVNGDGRDDLVVGARGADPNGGDSGASYVVFGAAGGFGGNLDLSALTGANGFKLSGVAASNSSGQSVSGAGDVNGDGYADLIISAPNAAPSGGDSGASYVVFGKASGFTAEIQLSALNGTNGFRISGEAAGDKSGISVSGAGDVNGDGFDDLIIGAYQADPNGGGSGAAYVIFGAASGFSANVDLAAPGSVDGFRLAGLGVFDGLGRSVSGAGDVNGDGFDDVIVGAPYADPNGGASGASYVVFGSDYNDAVDFAGTAGNDSLSGGAGAEVFVAGLGNDALTGGGGADVFRGGEGDDRMVVSDTAFFDADGGTGSDTLALDGGGITLDLTLIADSKLTNIEVIDLTGSGNNILTLNVLEVLNLSDSTNTLRVDGDAGDVVNAGSGWTDLGTGVNPGYHTYTQPGTALATLLVDMDITQNVA